MDYAERLHVPLRWWVQGTMLVASMWLALVVALPEPAAWVLSGLLLAGMTGWFLQLGSVRVEVDAETLRAGRAQIPRGFLGEVTALDTEATRRLAGPEADARAYLLLRPYLKRSVRIEITDPRDPVPYWLIHSRAPDRLVAALTTPAGAPPLAQ